METLKIGSLLKGGEYKIVGILGQGGFGITYEAEQTGLKRRVAVKEFFFKGSCERVSDSSQVSVPTASNRELVKKFKQKFIREAQMIAAMDHDHIVRIYDVFEENGTAYYVMEYLSGGSLSNIVKAKGALSETAAIDYIRQIADALNYLHEQNTLHLDVKPSNVLLNQKGQLKLIDFGISKHYDEAGSQTSSTPVGISKGYAPLEQYQQGGDVSKFTPATDIYALGATLYFLVTGTVPPDASEVNEEGLPQLPKRLSANIRTSIEKAMSPRKKDRPQTIAAFLSLLDAKEENGADDEETTTVDTPKPAPAPSPAPSPRRNAPKWLWIALSAAAAIILCVILWPESRREKEDLATAKPEQLSVQSQSTKPVTGTLAGQEWVDLGLPSGLKWATTNVGASNPGDYGSYFAWGETTPKSSYYWDSYKWCNGDSASLTKYNTRSEKGTTDYKEKLALSDDAARQNWGSSWRMPTRQEFEELKANCTEEWTTMNGHAGLKFTSKKNGKSIFLPAAGWRSSSDLFESGSDGNYWSFSLNTDRPEYAWTFAVYSGGSFTYNYYRCYGLSVRPVTE